MGEQAGDGGTGYARGAGTVAPAGRRACDACLHTGTRPYAWLESAPVSPGVYICERVCVYMYSCCPARALRGRVVGGSYISVRVCGQEGNVLQHAALVGCSRLARRVLTTSPFESPDEGWPCQPNSYAGLS